MNQLLVRNHFHGRTWLLVFCTLSASFVACEQRERDWCIDDEE
jgi:hypothetical protein